MTGTSGPRSRDIPSHTRTARCDLASQMPWAELHARGYADELVIDGGRRGPSTDGYLTQSWAKRTPHCGLYW